MNTPKPLDLNKPLQARGGRKARFMGERKHPKRTLVFAVEENSNEEAVVGTDLFGNCSAFESPLDIVNIPTRTEGWVCVHNYGDGIRLFSSEIYPTKESATSAGSKHANFIVAARIEWEEEP